MSASLILTLIANILVGYCRNGPLKGPGGMSCSKHCEQNFLLWVQDVSYKCLYVTVKNNNTN